MINILLVCAVIFCLLVVSELLWKRKIIGVEVSRKLIHMITGVIVAFLPYFADWRDIQILSLAFLVVIFLSAKFNILRSIHSVRRVTIGEVLYAAIIAICAFLQPADWIFTVAILHLALADAMAALIGQKWGQATKYRIITHGKSLAGSLAFFVTSAVIFGGLIVFQAGINLPSWTYLLIVFPLLLTLLENISWYGSDNVTVPLAVILMLSNL